VSLQYSPVNGRLHQRDLHVFQAIRSMDEVLIANFMTFQDALDQGNYDLVEVRGFVPDLNRHLAACDVALVQGGLTIGMELTRRGDAFHLLPAPEPFRAEISRRASARPLRRRKAHGVRDVHTVNDRGCDHLSAANAGPAYTRRGGRSGASGQNARGRPLANSKLTRLAQECL
jgi:hypothetical protein